MYPVALISTLLSLTFSIQASQLPFTPTKYEVVTSFFEQDDPNTVDTTFDATTRNFGLLPNTSWAQLTSAIGQLNQESPINVAYKLFFLARHGEGYHNAAEDFYGSPLWNCYWSLQTGNSTVSWQDAKLTPVGEQQALTMNSAWSKQLSYGVPLPQKFYSSPLTRAADTLVLTWSNITLEVFPYSKPTFKEMIREVYGIHTCDQHNDMTYLSQRYPDFLFESGFSFADQLWNAKYRESDEHAQYRAHLFLNDVFTNDTSTFISVTAHSGFLSDLLVAINHRKFSLGTGQMIPVIVKATNEDMSQDSVYDPVMTATWGTAPTCSSNPTDTPFL